MRKRINNIFVLTFVFSFVFLVKFNAVFNPISKASDVEVDRKNDVKINKVTLISVGDIMFHIPQINSALSGKAYDFRPVFSDIKPLIEDADAALGNFEAVIGQSRRFSGYPRFNVPAETLKALKFAGFDILSIANNHIMDQGQAGLYNTARLIKKNGMMVIGAGESKDKKYVIINKNGIKIGILSYTFGTNFIRAKSNTLNYINIKMIKKDMVYVRRRSDFVIVYLHTGTEYLQGIENSQRKLFNEIARMGADCILCSHPHVARETENLNIDGKTVFVCYSMGNFLSNQNDKFTDIGLLIRLTIIKEEKKTRLLTSEVIPTYRLRYRSGNKTIYKVVPCEVIDNYRNELKAEDIAYVKDVYYNFTPAAISVLKHN